MKEKKGRMGYKAYGVLATITLGLLIVASGAALAKGPQGVAKTVHNLSTSGGGPFVSNNEEAICIFCHTPHGGSLQGPLWNRSSPTHSYRHYNSITLSPEISSSRAVNDESLLCLSCHDGSIAMNRVLNPSNSTGEQPQIDFGDAYMENMFVWGEYYPARVGGSPAEPSATDDLRDDHPISFSFYDVYQAATPAEKDELINPADIKTNGTVRLFGEATTGGLRIECSTCHDPHVNYDKNIPTDDPTADISYAPFLYTTNKQSLMCLTCHNK